MIFIYLLGVIAVGDKENVALQILLDNKPRASTEAKAFTLPDGVKPKSLVLTYLSACLYLAHIAWILTKMCLDVVAKIYIA